MAQKKIRPIWTEIGRIKPLGKTRRVKKQVPRPWRPFRISSYRLRERLKKPDELIIHRRPTGRPDVAIDPREGMAVSKTRVRGTLPERIVYKKLLQRRLKPDSDFDFQSSLLGGRLQLGGIVADFLFQFWRLIVRVQGPTHKTATTMLKDKQQAQLLVDMGYTIYDLDENIVYDPNRLEDWFRRYIDKMPSVGGRMAFTGLPTAGTIVHLATGEMNFAWTLSEHQRVEQLEDDVLNLQRDLERITAGRVITVNGLSDIDTNLGLVQAGEFRAGNSRTPGFGFSGVRIGWPPFRYIGEDWHIVGVENDVLQFGLRSTDGVAIAGAGAVRIDSDGITIIEGPDDLNAIKWITETDPDPVNRVVQIFGESTVDGYFLNINTGVQHLTEGPIASWTRLIANSKGDGTWPYSTELFVRAGDDNNDQVVFELFQWGEGGTNRSFIMVETNDNQTGAEGFIALNDNNQDVDFVWRSDNNPWCLYGDASKDLVTYKNMPLEPVFDYEHTTRNQNNSTAWFTDYEVTIPAGTLKANDVVIVETWGTYINNSGSTYTENRRYSINGVNYTFVGDSQTTSALYRIEHGTVIFNNANSLSFNDRYGYWEVHNDVRWGALTINTATTDVVIKLERQWATAHSQAQFHTRLNRTLIIEGG